MAGGPGFEPGLTESESVVLPLDDPPTVGREAAPKSAAVCLRPIKRALLYHINLVLLSPSLSRWRKFSPNSARWLAQRLAQGLMGWPAPLWRRVRCYVAGYVAGCGTAASGRRLAGLCTMALEIPQDGKSWQGFTLYGGQPCAEHHM